jgi:hypothetical protein
MTKSGRDSNEVVNYLKSLPSPLTNEMGGACGAYGGGGVHRVLVGNPERKRPLGRPRRRWEDNIKMNLQEVGGIVGIGWSWRRIGIGGGHL